MIVSEANNIHTALKHNRVTRIKLEDEGSLLLRYSLAELQEPFPMLDYLDIRDRTNFFYARPPVVLSESFLGGSAPSLVHLRFGGLLFFGLPKLLLSANNLVDICLWEDSPYISPEGMATSLCTMKHLQSLDITFQFDSYGYSHRAGQRPHPITRIVLPALSRLSLKCTEDYVEDFVARLDTPSLELMEISRLSSFESDFSELPQFISRIKALEISDQAQLFTHNTKFQLKILKKDRAELSLIFMSPSKIVWSAFPPLHFERLEIREDRLMMLSLKMNAESELRELSHRFTAVKNLFLDPNAAVHVADALTTFAEESMTGLFPALQYMYFHEFPLLPPIQEAFLRFTAARQVTRHPVTLREWEWGK